MTLIYAATYVNENVLLGFNLKASNIAGMKRCVTTCKYLRLVLLFGASHTVLSQIFYVKYGDAGV